jgi:hypothetical protein
MLVYHNILAVEHNFLKIPLVLKHGFDSWDTVDDNQRVTVPETGVTLLYISGTRNHDTAAVHETNMTLP